MAKQQTKPQSFEAALEELEEILAQIEGGQIALEESITKYERGHFLLRWCRGVLDKAEKQMTELAADAEGKLHAVGGALGPGEAAGKASGHDEESIDDR